MAYNEGKAERKLVKCAPPSRLNLNDSIVGTLPKAAPYAHTIPADPPKEMSPLNVLPWLYAPEMMAGCIRDDASIELFHALDFECDVDEIVRRIIVQELTLDQVQIVTPSRDYD